MDYQICKQEYVVDEKVVFYIKKLETEFDQELTKTNEKIQELEAKIESTTYEPIRMSHIREVQALYERHKKTCTLCEKFLTGISNPENQNMNFINQIIWEFNNGQFRTKQELFYKSEDYKIALQDRDSITILCLLIPAIFAFIFGCCSGGIITVGFACAFVSLPIGGLIAIIPNLLFNESIRCEVELEITETKPINKETTIYGITTTKGIYDTLKNTRISDFTYTNTTAI